LDLVLWYWLGCRRSWGFSNFLRQTSALSAATISNIWQSGVTGEQSVILPLGLSVRSVCHRTAFMFVFVETMTPWPNKSPEPTADAALGLRLSVLICRVASRLRLSFFR
jgi:hypothetical protein